MIKISVSQNDANQRLDKFLKKYLRNAPLSHIYKLIRKDVKVNGKREDPKRTLYPGDEIIIYMTEEDEKAMSGARAVVRQKPQFEIAYEDKNMLIAEKPLGLLVHGSALEKKKTLANQVAGYLFEKGEFDPGDKTFSPSPVNRLDRNTTGLVIFGKTGQALKSLNQMMKEKNRVKKYYLTVVSGEIKKDMTLRGRLEKDQNKNMVNIQDGGPAGKEIETKVRVLDRAKGFTFIEVELVTGRTHQIRAHLAHAGYPVIGDAKYGNRQVNQKIGKNYSLTTQFLHAGRLRFDDMVPYFSYMAGREVKAELPKEFEKIVAAIFGGNDRRNS